MLRVLILAVGLCGALALTAQAADGDKKPEQPEGRKRPALTEEQKTLRKEMIEKYDKNKNGKLDPEERQTMSAEDKEKLTKAGLGPRKKKDESK